MNGNHQTEMHYINTGFPYTVTESFMNFFEDLAHPNAQHVHMGSVHDQEAAYWSMNMNYYKFGLTGPANTPYYGLYEVNDYLPRMDLNRRAWEYPTVTSIEEPTAVDVQSGAANSVSNMQAIPEECAPSPDNEPSSEVVWQDGIDLDNMTYEELLDLGEAVGTQNRGLSEELINMLPTSTYKSGGFFLRKKSGERCVICQMRYKRGDRQINLPCKHVYHTKCGSKWLSINKTCPICNVEVFGDEPSQH